mgnify:CR=1 FL=1
MPYTTAIPTAGVALQYTGFRIATRTAQFSFVRQRLRQRQRKLWWLRLLGRHRLLMLHLRTIGVRLRRLSRLQLRRLQLRRQASPRRLRLRSASPRRLHLAFRSLLRWRLRLLLLLLHLMESFRSGWETQPAAAKQRRWSATMQATKHRR